MTKVSTLTEFTMSARTKSIVANFSGINPSLLFKPGSQLRTISANQDLMAVAKIEEVFPRQFGIHDLSKFLSIISLYDSPTIKFNEHSCTIISSENKNKHYSYRYTSPTMILQAPDEDVVVGDTIETFELGSKDLAELVKVISISKHPEVAFVAKDGSLSIQALDSKNINGDMYVNAIRNTDKVFHYVFKIEKMLNLMITNYTVNISDGLAIFESPDVKYVVAAESEV